MLNNTHLTLGSLKNNIGLGPCGLVSCCGTRHNCNMLNLKDKFSYFDPRPYFPMFVSKNKLQCNHCGHNSYFNAPPLKALLFLPPTGSDCYNRLTTLWNIMERTGYRSLYLFWYFTLKSSEIFQNKSLELKTFTDSVKRGLVWLL